MSRRQWSERNESLNAFQDAIQQGTHELICDLSVDLTNGDYIFVLGTSRRCYGLHLAIHTTKQFGDSQRAFAETQSLLSVDGSPLELVVAHPRKDETCDALSTHDADRRPQLTMAAST